MIIFQPCVSMLHMHNIFFYFKTKNIYIYFFINKV